MANAEISSFESCRFPALLLYPEGLCVYEHSEAFTTCGMADVRARERGRYAQHALNPAIALGFQFGYHWRGVSDAERWATAHV